MITYFFFCSFICKPSYFIYYSYHLPIMAAVMLFCICWTYISPYIPA